MFNMTLLMQGLQLAFAIFNEVHTIQVALPGAPGADKSAQVLNKVIPIANVIGAEASNVQGIIDGIVQFSKAFKLGAWAEPVAVGAVPGPAAPVQNVENDTVNAGG